MNRPVALKGKPITNVLTYLKAKHPGCTIPPGRMKHIDMQSFRQEDYGKAGDCTITSMATILFHQLGCKDPKGFQRVYDAVEAAATRSGYSGKGTNPFAMRTILDRSGKEFNLQIKSKVKYLKGVGWNFDHVKDSINKGKPVMLSLNNDGRDYNTNHTITICGYAIYECKLSDGTKSQELFFQVYDNWRTEVRYLDYQMLSTVSSINCL